jgi:hypothetical protein
MHAPAVPLHLRIWHRVVDIAVEHLLPHAG